jgi:hypothetical protein
MSNPYEPHGLDRDQEQRLRDLLDEATSDVMPDDGLDAIQSRTKVRTMSGRPWLVAATAAVVTTAATVAAVAVLGTGGDPSGSEGPGPAGSTTAAESPTRAESPEPAQTTEPSPPTPDDPVPVEGAVPVYYVGDTGQGPRLYREFHPSVGGAPLAQALADAVTRAPDDPDYRTPWPAGTDVSSSFDGVGADGEIGVDITSPGGSLHDRPAGMSAAEAEMAVQQLVYTAQAAVQATAPVQFRLDGDRTDQLLGVPVSEPLARGDESSTLAQVWIISPGEGAEVRDGFEVSGVGAFFEANVAWELRRGGEGGEDGPVVASNADRPVMAAECCTMAPYSFTVDVPDDTPPGDYTLVVHDEDMSGGEGFEPFRDTKTLTLTR